MKLTILILVLFTMAVSTLAELCEPEMALYILIGAYRRQCNEDKTWKSPQVHSSTGLQWCVNRTTGEILGEKVREQLICP